VGLWFAVLIGGALGSAARHGVNVAASRWFESGAPYATATVNLIGSLIIGVLAGALAAQRLSLTITVRAFVFVGLLGGFTTFSSFMLDTLTLSEAGSSTVMMGNLLGQVVVGFLLVYAGYHIGLRAGA
jgi:fluoride exporter